MIRVWCGRLLLGLLPAAFPAPWSAAWAAPSRGGPAVQAPASLHALLENALSRLNTRDTLGLSRLAVGKEEFLELYPLFASDTSRARRDFACQYFLADNRKLAERSLEREGGQSLALSRFVVEGPVEERKGFILHRGLRIWIRQGETEQEIHFLKSAAQLKSGWKIWSFDDP